MSFVAAALQHTAEFAETESLKRFRDSLDPRWISEALEATGTATLRRRRLPADQVIWLVLGMALQRDRPITEVVSKLDLALPGQGGSDVLAPSSVVHARHRLGAAPMKWLFEKCALSWAGAGQRWRGLALYGADGSTLRVADTDENREHFGLARGRAGASGYPLVRIVTLMRLRSRVLAAAAFGPYSKSELGLCEGLWSHVPDDSLTVVDRLFCSASVLLGLQSGGENRHWLLRARKNAKWTVLESFGRYDKLVELTVSRDARRKNPDLPKKFVARAVSYKHPRSKGRQCDGGSNLETGKCGSPMKLGNPTEAQYQAFYFEMLSAVATHLKMRADRYRALAYIKPSGANLFTHENRLPKRCKTDESCLCNTKQWADAGYRPSGLYAFYQAQNDLLASAFEGKAISYALIQAGYPRVNEDGGYALFDGSSSDGNSLPSGTEQTEQILEDGRLLQAERFVVTHNGVGPAPPAGTCPNYQQHPVPLHNLGWYAGAGSKCPSKWALQQGAHGQITGYQTNNAKGVATPAELDSTFQNLWDNSDGVYLEIYEQRLWEAGSDVLDPTATEPRSIASWDAQLDLRRPKPMVHQHTFTADGNDQTFWYVHGQKCDAPGGSPQAYGVITVTSP